MNTTSSTNTALRHWQVLPNDSVGTFIFLVLKMLRIHLTVMSLILVNVILVRILVNVILVRHNVNLM